MSEKNKLLQVRVSEEFLSELDDLVDQVSSINSRAEAVRYSVATARRLGTPREADQVTVRDHYFDFVWHARNQFVHALRNGQVLSPGEISDKMVDK